MLFQYFFNFFENRIWFDTFHADMIVILIDTI